MSHMYNYKYINKKINAITITELLLDLVLSVIVMTAVLNLYISYKKTFELQADNSFLYQNSKVAYDYLKNDIKIAGYFGCNSDASSIEYVFTPGVDYDLSNTITAHEANSTGLNSTIDLTNPPSGITPGLSGQETSINPDNGSDIITIRFVDTDPIGLLNANTNGDILYSTGIGSYTNTGDKLLVSDCIRSVAFEADTINSNSIIPNSSVGNINEGAEIYKIHTHTYYIKTDNNIRSLYRLTNGVEELLVPYVENMQLLYGQDTNSDGVTDIFRTADNLTSDSITSITLGLIIRSINKHYSASYKTALKLLDAPNVFGSTITVNTANDSYIRQAFDFNINFPNSIG